MCVNHPVEAPEKTTRASQLVSCSQGWAKLGFHLKITAVLLKPLAGSALRRRPRVVLQRFPNCPWTIPRISAPAFKALLDLCPCTGLRRDESRGHGLRLKGLHDSSLSIEGQACEQV